MRAKFRKIFALSTVSGLLFGPFLLNSHAENNQTKVRTEVYKCVNADGTSAVYSSSPIRERGISCESLNVPKFGLKKVSSDKFDKMSRARIAKLTKKKPDTSVASPNKPKKKGKVKAVKKSEELQNLESAQSNQTGTDRVAEIDLGAEGAK